MHQFGESPDNCPLLGGHRPDRRIDPDGHGNGTDGGPGAGVPVGHCADHAGPEGVHGAECCKYIWNGVRE